MYDHHDLHRLDESRRQMEAQQAPYEPGKGLGGSVIAWGIIAAALLGIIWFVAS